MKATGRVLLIEDSDEDFEITTSALLAAGVTGPFPRCSTGRQAMDVILQRGSHVLASEPRLILLDLNIPGGDGRHILAELRKSWLAAVPAVVLSTSSNPRDVRLCYQLGAAGYLLKPVDLVRFEAMMEGFARYWLNTVLLPEQEGQDAAASLSAVNPR